MSDIGLLGKVDITTGKVTDSKDKVLNNLMSLLSDFNLEKFEPNLAEDFNEGLGRDEEGEIIELNKYYFLAYLQDAFKEYNKSGDEFLNVYRGKCGGDFCKFYNKKTYCIEGNKSKKRIAFVVSNINNEILTDNDELRFAKGCDNFINNEGQKMDVDFEMYMKSMFFLFDQLETMNDSK